jgi:hypothetical protein
MNIEEYSFELFFGYLILTCRLLLLWSNLTLLYQALWWANRHMNIIPSLVDSGWLLLSDLRCEGTVVLLKVQLVHDLVSAVCVLKSYICGSHKFQEVFQLIVLLLE